MSDTEEEICDFYYQKEKVRDSTLELLRMHNEYMTEHDRYIHAFADRIENLISEMIEKKVEPLITENKRLAAELEKITSSREREEADHGLKDLRPIEAPVDPFISIFAPIVATHNPVTPDKEENHR